MKKLVLILVLILVAVLATACGHKEYPERVSPDGHYVLFVNDQEKFTVTWANPSGAPNAMTLVWEDIPIESVGSFDWAIEHDMQLSVPENVVFWYTTVSGQQVEVTRHEATLNFRTKK